MKKYFFNSKLKICSYLLYIKFYLYIIEKNNYQKIKIKFLFFSMKILMFSKIFLVFQSNCMDKLTKKPKNIVFFNKN